MPRTFTAPRRFDPARSLLGRLLCRLAGDARRGEAWYVLTLAALALGLVLGQYLAWAVLEPAIAAAPQGPLALVFWAAQLGAAALVVLVGAVGFRPAVAATLTPEALVLEQGRRRRALALEDVTAARPIPARTFHRHYARYAATEVFAAHLHDEVLLVETTGAPVVVALAAADQAALADALTDALAYERPTARVA
ncbi:MAG: hypothetical protein R3247_11680 [Rhodothermales bacterium]|nr:hypothetical protein [Rhodothermales bacterium]